MKYLTPLAGVKILNLAGTIVSEELVSTVEQMTGLQQLDVSNYSPQNLLTHQELAFLTKLQRLRCLRMGGASHFGDEGVPILTQLRELSELELSACGVSSAGINQLSVLGSLENLRVVKCARLDASGIGSAVGRAVYAGHRHVGLPGAAHIGLLPS
jgi:hypothetical protein